jgi:hypothetical protein
MTFGRSKNIYKNLEKFNNSFQINEAGPIEQRKNLVAHIDVFIQNRGPLLGLMSEKSLAFKKADKSSKQQRKPPSFRNRHIKNFYQIPAILL